MCVGAQPYLTVGAWWVGEWICESCVLVVLMASSEQTFRLSFGFSYLLYRAIFHSLAHQQPFTIQLYGPNQPCFLLQK